MNDARRVRGLSTFAFALVLSLGAVACGAEDTTAELTPQHTEELVSTTGAYHVQVAPDGALKIGKNRLVASVVSPRQGSVVAAKAFMPLHGHGTEGATVSRDAQGGYVIDGISMFMSGKWEITLSLRGGQSDDTLRFYVDVP